MGSRDLLLYVVGLITFALVILYFVSCTSGGLFLIQIIGIVISLITLIMSRVYKHQLQSLWTSEEYKQLLQITKRVRKSEIEKDNSGIEYVNYHLSYDDNVITLKDYENALLRENEEDRRYKEQQKAEKAKEEEYERKMKANGYGICLKCNKQGRCPMRPINDYCAKFDNDK